MKGVCNDKKISRGEIYVADLNPYQGFEQGGIRPVVILQNDAGNIAIFLKIHIVNIHFLLNFIFRQVLHMLIHVVNRVIHMCELVKNAPRKDA